MGDITINDGDISCWVFVVIWVSLDHSLSLSEHFDDSSVRMFTCVNWSNFSDNSQSSDDLIDSVNSSHSSFDHSSKMNNLSTDNVSWSFWMTDDNLWNFNMWRDVMNSVSNVNILLSNVDNLFMKNNDSLSDWFPFDFWDLWKFNSQDMDFFLDLSDDLNVLLFGMDQFMNDLFNNWTKSNSSWSSWEWTESLVSDDSDGVFNMSNLVSDVLNNFMELSDLLFDDNFLVFSHVSEFIGQFSDCLSNDNSSLDEFDNSSSQGFDNVSFSTSELSWFSESFSGSERFWSSHGLNSLSNNSHFSNQSSDGSSENVDFMNNSRFLISWKGVESISQMVDSLSDNFNSVSDSVNLLSQRMNDGLFNVDQFSWFSSEYRSSDSFDGSLDDVDSTSDFFNSVLQDSNLVNEIGSTFNWLRWKLSGQLRNCLSDHSEFVCQFDDSLGKSPDNLVFDWRKLFRISLTFSHNKLSFFSLGNQSLGELDLFLGEDSPSFGFFGSSLDLNVSSQYGSSLCLGDGD